MVDLNQLTSKTAICGYVLAVALPVALTAGDRVTQLIAGVIGIVSIIGLGVFAPDANKTITTTQVAELGRRDPDAPLTPRSLVELDSSAAVRRDPPVSSSSEPSQAVKDRLSDDLR